MEAGKLIKRDINDFGKHGSCDLHCLLVCVDDLKEEVSRLVNIIRDTSWMSTLDSVSTATFEATSEATVKKITELFQDFAKSKDEAGIGPEIGEYIVSMCGRKALNDHAGHLLIPLAELIKEKVSGNPGFDFHSVTTTGLIAFGEAKYSGSKNPYSNAFQQIADFASAKKDVAELVVLEKFVPPEAIKKFLDERRSYSAAFSINGKNINAIFDSAIKSNSIEPLLKFEEIYLVGVVVNA